MRRIFICAPYEPNTKSIDARVLERNNESLQKMARMCELLACFHETPIAPYLLAQPYHMRPEVLDALILRWIEDCDIVYVMGREITPLMANQIHHACECGIEVRIVDDANVIEERLLHDIMAVSQDEESEEE
ncbi:DUF7768 domain-containing protein [Streptococcus alactolyticus]|uniref:DUF7768 domain-containing protein n=1 Tax=Streptococcus alactolyticus TaxID=29389 RepID=UPI003F9DBB58